MKRKIEAEFMLWIRQYTQEKPCISAGEVDNWDGTVVWCVDVYHADGKDFYEYKGNGQFEYMGSKC